VKKWEWEWEGMGIDNMGMGGSGNVKSHSRSSLVNCKDRSTKTNRTRRRALSE